jgi:hypothetical protein
VTLGVGGIVIVLVSVVCALGIFGYAGVTTTLLTIEVSASRFEVQETACDIPCATSQALTSCRLNRVLRTQLSVKLAVICR